MLTEKGKSCENRKRHYKYFPRVYSPGQPRAKVIKKSARWGSEGMIINATDDGRPTDFGFMMSADIGQQS